MKPITCIVSSNFCECNKQALYTADQLRQAKVEVLREAAENVTIWIKELEADDRYYVREQLQRMADKLEGGKT